MDYEFTQKIELNAPFPITNYTEHLIHLYNYFSRNENDLSTEEHIAKGYKPVMQYLNDLMYSNSIVFIDDIQVPQLNLKVDNTVIVGYSSGIDSTYQALRFKHEGYNVVLLHLANLNRSYPDEATSCEQFAKYYGFKLIEVDVKHIQTEHWVDNPLKNQVLCIGLAIDLALQLGTNKIALGNHESSDISTCHIQYSYTDAIEVFTPFLESVRSHVNNFEYFPVDKEKIDCFKFITENYPEALKFVNSCIAPHRFKKTWNKNAREKFGLETITDNRCMICTKCIKEYVMLCHIGYMKPNEEYINHFCNHLRKKGDNLADLRLVVNKNDTNEDIINKVLNS